MILVDTLTGRRVDVEIARGGEYDEVEIEQAFWDDNGMDVDDETLQRLTSDHFGSLSQEWLECQQDRAEMWADMVRDAGH